MKKKILIVTDFFEPHKSGIVTYINNMIDSIKDEKNEITILTTLYNDNLNNKIINKNLKIIRCKPTFKISRGFYSLELVFKFIKIRKNFDIVNIHFPITEIFPLCLFFNKKTTILNYHCLPDFVFYLNFIKFYFYIFGIISSLRSSKIIVLSKDYFLNIFLHKYIYNKLIEIPPYVVLSKDKVVTKKTSKKLTLGYLGRLSEEKGLTYLIKLSNQLSKLNITHELLIAGDNHDNRFKKYISRLNVLRSNNKSIKFIGKIKDSEKFKFLNKLDVFIFPSLNSFEAFGIVQLEAMSQGVPVISSDIYGVRTVVSNTKNGLLFQNKNLKDLLDKFFIFKNNVYKAEEIKKNLLKFYNKETFDINVKNLFNFF